MVHNNKLISYPKQEVHQPNVAKQGKHINFQQFSQ